MTTLAVTPTHTTPLSRRLLNVVRLNLANPFTIIGMPLMILGVIFAANWAIWLLILNLSSPADRVDAINGMSYSGASFFIYVYMLVIAVQAMNLTFSLAMGFSSTRRDFYLGSVITLVGLSAFYALVLGVLSALEDLTHGWGLNGRMFTNIYLGLDTPVGLRIFYSFALFLFFSFIGAAIASTYVRWKQRGLLLCFLVTAIVLIGALTLITLTGLWPAVGSFVTSIGLLGGFSLSLVVSVLAALAGYLVMRRATPRS